MDKNIIITLIIVIGAIVVFGMGFSSFGEQSLDDTISVTGQSTLKINPDRAVIYFNVQTRDSDSKEASQLNAEMTESTIEELLKAGFSREDIKTENFNMYQEYDWQGNTNKGKYVVSHDIKLSISTDEPEKIGRAVDSGVSGGATVRYINFELSPDKLSALKAEALKLAAGDAKLKADAIASGIGKKVGKVVSISDNEFGYPIWNVYEARAGGAVADNSAEAKQAVTSIQPGEREHTSQVTVVYKIR